MLEVLDARRLLAPAPSRAQRITLRLAPSLFGLAGLLASLPVQGQSLPADAGTEAGPAQAIPLLDTVTVTATRSPHTVFDVPASVSTVGRQALDDAQASTIGTTLRPLPNVNAGGGPRPAAQVPAIRGLQGPRIILSVDGARRNDAGGNHTPLLIDPDVVRQIDIVRGPVSAAYGSGGLGGVMAFETIGVDDVLADGQRAGGRVRTGYRSANEQWSANLTTAARADQLDLLASGTYRHSGDIHTGASGSHASYPNDGRLKNGLFKGGYSPTAYDRVELSYQHFDDRNVGPNHPGGNMLFPFSQRFARRQTQHTGSWAFCDADRRLLNGKLTVYRTAFKRDGESRNVPPLDSTATQTTTLGASLQNTSRLDIGARMAHILTYGVDTYRDTNENTSAGNANSVLPDGHMRATGVFVQDEVTLWENWTVIGALRHDDYRLNADGQAPSSHHKLSPKATVQYRPWEPVSVYASYGKAFRAPTLTEMFGNLSTPRAMFNFRSNPALKPETSIARELGATLALDDLLAAGDQFRLKSAYFTEDVKDMISQEQVGRYAQEYPFKGTGLVFQQMNVARAKRRGGELEASYTTRRLTMGVGYSRLRAYNAQTRANLYAPPDKLSVGASYRIDANWTAHYLGQFVRAQDYDTLELRRRSGYVTHDLGLTHERGPYRVDIGVTNLLDKRYATYQQSRADTFSYEEGRSVNISLSARF